MLGIGLAVAQNYGASNAFDPQSLFAAGEQGVWYDPSDFSTLFQDTAGTSPVTAIGQSVALIRDKSGRNNHASQSTFTSQPLLQQDTSGRYYLSFDGTDDSMSTSSINFSGTSLMTVFAGVRKLTSATDQIMVELSAIANSNNGAFWMLAQFSGAATSNYAIQTRGTANNASQYNTYVPPITNVLTASLTTIASGASTSIVARINGSAVTRTAGAGVSAATSGNFGTYPLFIGRRNNASLPFNGRLYSLIVRGASSTAQQITDAERWVNSKTGAY